MDKIKRLNRELKYRGRILDFYEDTIQTPEGHIAHWDFLAHKGAAAVVPVLPDGRIIMVRQYRNALDRFTLEIPAGAKDSAEEEGIVCAARELEEETGYRCEQLEPLVKLVTTVAFCNETIDVFLARNLIPSAQHLDEDEFIELETHTIEELSGLIHQGIIQDSKTVAALMAYKDLRQK